MYNLKIAVSHDFILVLPFPPFREAPQPSLLPLQARENRSIALYTRTQNIKQYTEKHRLLKTFRRFPGLASLHTVPEVEGFRLTPRRSHLDSRRSKVGIGRGREGQICMFFLRNPRGWLKGLYCAIRSMPVLIVLSNYWFSLLEFLTLSSVWFSLNISQSLLILFFTQ